MKYVVSRYNHHLAWLADYTGDAVVYDRSESPLQGSIAVPNIGSDIYDKLTFIVDNYSALPDVAAYIKANLFDYITPKEFEAIRFNETFTPILTMRHKEIPGVSFYQDGIYWEVNNRWFLGAHPVQHPARADELYHLLGIAKMDYIPFAPGSNYILPKRNILKHPKSFYEKLRAYLEWTIYPGEAQVIERGLYTLWR